ncbi:MAG TPA: glucosamine-6-phosphate deaminase [Candidatus Aphodoplasma excrementigallinarum]|uniref:Glucosamine-6-phosphate deaminase n=1 Tax=Candidatus Aphodoplasma excrementigallinarum TaxID=2840673 RepID=A0A9D1T003_9FIRM|nr:glucosamine-6-phosphate deaminase [Candidatus Aphodoplasma excrementigallinarum]
MKKIVCKNYDELSKCGADIVTAQIKAKPDSVLGLATGSTPIGLYKYLREMPLDFSNISAYNLDEYYPIEKANDQSYAYFMNDNLFQYITVKSKDIPNGEAPDAEAECRRYDKAIEQAGGIDLQVLGLGVNGHIGFNEPAKALSVGTHAVDLTESTIEANARFFANKEAVPRRALTLGLGGIMKAKKILVLASGKNKADVVKKMFSGEVTTDVPASLLQLHGDVTVIVDEEANGEA